MNALEARRAEDVARLRALQARTNGRFRLLGTHGSPISEITAEIKVRTPSNSSFPRSATDVVPVHIALAPKYPFEAPSVTLRTRVFNPNVYESGRVCLGSKWMATEYLDLLMQRVFRILAFDESVINTASAANRDAASWYLQAKARSPQLFPTDVVAMQEPSKPTMRWTNVGSAPSEAMTIVKCRSCAASLRVPAGKSLNVTCPTCRASFRVDT